MNDHSYPVFKGLGRKATFMGIPTRLLLGAFAVVAMIAMTAGLAWWGLLFVVMPTLAILTRDDDKALDVLWLEFKTRKRNRNQRFWKGSSYAPTAADQLAFTNHRIDQQLRSCLSGEMSALARNQAPESSKLRFQQVAMMGALRH